MTQRIRAIDELDTAFDEMLGHQTGRGRRRLRSRPVALVGVLAVLLGGGVAGAAGLGVWRSDTPAGDPPDGRFELKLNHDGVTYGLLVWRPANDRICYEVGPESEFAKYPLADGGGCFDPQRAFREKGFTASRSTRDGVALLSGIAGPDVAEITVVEDDHAEELTLSEPSRGFMTTVGEHPVDVVATFEDGRRDTIAFPELPSQIRLRSNDAP